MTKISEEGLFLDRHTLVLELDLATKARLAKRCHVTPRLDFWKVGSIAGHAFTAQTPGMETSRSRAF